MPHSGLGLAVLGYNQVLRNNDELKYKSGNYQYGQDSVKYDKAR